MPAKGTTFLTGPRNMIFSKEFYDTVRETTGLDIDDKTIRQIILESNQEIPNLIVETSDAFKLPNELGYITVIKYKSKKKAIDWINTNKLGKIIYLTNLHSFNNIYHIKWFKFSESHFGIKQVYKFEPMRILKRRVAKNIKEGKDYFEWKPLDFWNMDKLNNKLKRQK